MIGSTYPELRFDQILTHTGISIDMSAKRKLLVGGYPTLMAINSVRPNRKKPNSRLTYFLVARRDYKEIIRSSYPISRLSETLLMN